LKEFENKGINYIVKDPELFKNKNIVISGGGDSALDWALYFANDYSKDVTLVHRSQQFRAHNDSVQKAMDMANDGKINLLLDSEVKTIDGNGSLKAVKIKSKTSSDLIEINCDYWLPLFGLTPKLGPIANWGLEIEKNAIKVDNSDDYSTNIPGIYAIGDVNTYKGKLKLILCGFHEAAIMAQSAFKRIHPNKKNILKYTTVTGISGFGE
jgi:thioredoxin reductase (NADPH)